uniref:Uncharacterized protein n=1 Tax=Marseillevirus LCMAC201 TaxID=2506605 RepID=A0A481YW26_9VIRU|nr:MAG: hypothetical protein LCMAC201_03830 [Marseillevirus LCMAC201]
MSNNPLLFPCSLKTTRTIAERWSTTIEDLPIEEKTELIVQILDSVINGSYCGLCPKFDYIFLRCEKPIITELCQALQAKPELQGLCIKVGEYTTHGVEIRPEPIVVPSNTAVSADTTSLSLESTIFSDIYIERTERGLCISV